MAHNIQELIEMTVKSTLLKAHPIGKLWLTLGNEDPSKIIGGGGRRLRATFFSAVMTRIMPVHLLRRDFRIYKAL